MPVGSLQQSKLLGDSARTVAAVTGLSPPRKRGRPRLRLEYGHQADEEASQALPMGHDHAAVILSGALLQHDTQLAVKADRADRRKRQREPSDGDHGVADLQDEVRRLRNQLKKEQDRNKRLLHWLNGGPYAWQNLRAHFKIGLTVPEGLHLEEAYSHRACAYCSYSPQLSLSPSPPFPPRAVPHTQR